MVASLVNVRPRGVASAIFPCLLTACLWYFLHPTQYLFPAATHPTYPSLSRPERLAFPETFPHLLWQTAPNETFEERWAEKTASWVELNPTWERILLDDTEMDEFVHTHYTHRPGIIGFWDELKTDILRTDLWRYLALLAQGGVYSDMDTTAMRPIDDWIPAELRGQEINVVAGLEYADTTYRIFPRNISFCQWTLMSKPNHPVFDAVVGRVISRLEYIARVQKVALSDIHLTREEILAATGPGAFSDAVLEAVRDGTNDPSVGWNDFFGLKRPKLFGDVLVLPVTAFGWGQKHSNSSDPEYGQPALKHHFGSSWFKKQRPQKHEEELAPVVVAKQEIAALDEEETEA